MRLLSALLLFIAVAGTTLSAQTPVVTVRFANPQYNCATDEYCLDVEYKSNTANQRVFGTNVRFFYDDNVLELINFRNFETGYSAVAPNPPTVSTGGAGSGALFGFGGPAEFVNGAIQLTNSNAPPLFISTTGWTKVFTVCFHVDNAANLDVFCPSVVWDLEQNPANGGFLAGDDGVVVTLVDPNNSSNSLPSTENVAQYNWQYTGSGTPPYGAPNPTSCISIRCIDVALELAANNLTPNVGQNVIFTITVDNAAGSDPATNVAVTSLLPNGYTYVSDNGAGAYNSGSGLWTIGTLNGGATTTLQITATVNPSGNYLMLAEVTAATGKDADSTPNNGVDTDNDTNVVNDPGDEDDGDGELVSPQAPKISVAKTDVLNLGPDNKLNAGDQITYTITVTNTGNVTLTNVTVSDPGTSGLACIPAAPFSLTPSQSVTCTATHTLTQAEIDAGSYSNVATATGTPPIGQPVTDASDDPDNPANVDPNNDGNPDDPTVTPLPATPDITLTKTDAINLGGDGILNAGDVITYTITVTNTGNVTLSNVTVSDPGTTGLACIPATPFTLAPGQSVTCTATHSITQTEINSGSYSNVASASGTPPTGPAVTDNSDDPDNPANADPNNDGDPDDPTVTPLPNTPGIAVTKTDVLNLGADNKLNAGDVINYTITVTNTGNVTLINVTVSDPGTTGLACIPATPFSLAPGASVTCTATRTLTQANIDAGTYSNVATATGQPPTGPTVADNSDDPDNPANADPNNDGNPDDPTVTPLPANPDITLTKTGLLNLGGDGKLNAGDQINYTITVTNVGNVTLSNVTVSDPGTTGLACIPATPFSLAPGASVTCTATRTLTQANIDAGTYSNVASATGTSPGGTPVSDNSDDPGNPADSDPNNDGDPDDPTVTPLPQTPDITLTKTDVLSLGADNKLNAGDQITYTITVTNVGNVTLNNVTVSDPGTTGLACIPATPFSLAPGASVTCTATRTLTQANIDAGTYSNVASASGTSPNNTPVSDNSDDPDNPANADPNSDGDPDDPTITPLPANPGIAVVKTDALNLGADNKLNAGDVITYTITVTNTGNVTLSNVSVSDPGTTGLACIPAAPFSLAPGASVTCTATHTLTQTEINSGSYSNVATATGQPPTGPTVTDTSDDPDNPANVDPNNDGNPDDPTVTPLPASPGIAVIKTDALNLGADNKLNAGDVITYTITVTNSGNVTLSNITVSDPGTTGLACIPAAPFSLAPGASVTCTATHALTQTEINSGSYSNVATATGNPPTGPAVTDASDDPDNPANVDPNNDGNPDDPTVTPLPASPGIAVVKTDALSLGADNKLNAGDVITYTITVTNTGNVTLSNVSVSDPGTTGLACIPATPFSLAPGASVTCTATRTLTQANIDAGTYSNVASASGTPPTGPAVTDNSDDPDNPANVDPNNDGNPDDPTVTPLPASPSIAVIKTDVLNLGADNKLNAGDVITYTITVTNTGNVTLSNVSVSDPGTTGLACIPAAPFSLAPGASVTCTATRTLTQANIDAGSYSNVATATGTPPVGPPVTDNSDDPDNPTNTDPNNDGNPDDPTTTSLPATPGLSVLKTDVLDLGPNGNADIGDIITYTITVTNTGNVTISNILVSDANATGLSCAAPFSLAPGASQSCTAIHALTATDINTRIVTNVAIATGQTPGGAPVTDASDDPDNPANVDPNNDGNPDDPTLTQLPCITINAWVYLEGAAIFPDGSELYSVPMRTTLNNLRVLPGQTYNDFFLGTYYTPKGQPYNIAPWNYNGTEGDNYDSGGDLNFADADYPSTVVDWVLVSLRSDPAGTGGPICQAAALLHKDGHIQFVDQFECCDINLNLSYYVVIEHRNHLIVMSHVPVAISGGSINYDFRTQQSYIDDPFQFGTFSGQKQFLPGLYCMYGGNGNQTLSSQSDTDINFDDRTYWESQNGEIARYRNGDYNLNGDTNFNDRRVWEINNGRFTSVPRN